METKKKAKRRAGWYYDLPDVEEGYPSVTTILKVSAKPALDRWRVEKALKKYVETEDYELAKIAPYMAMKEAGDDGTNAHNLIDAYWKGHKYNKATMSGSLLDYIEAFEKFLKDHDLKLIESEGTCFSHKEKYAGTFDGLFEVNGEVWLVDWKTSNYVVDEHKIQIIAYRKALEEMGRKVDRCVIVQLNNDRSYNMFDVVREGTNKVGEKVDRYRAFLACKYLYHTKLFND